MRFYTRFKFENSFSVFQSFWASSLAWLEHPADNREVAGSNPAWPTFFSQGKKQIDSAVSYPKKVDEGIAHQVEIEIKYEGYIQRQLRDVEKFKHQEKIKIPPELDYAKVYGLSNELREKLASVKPVSLGQASRIPGITPAAISIIMIYLKKHEEDRGF